MSFPFETMPVDTSFLQYVRLCACVGFFAFLFCYYTFVSWGLCLALLVQNMLHFAIAFKTMINNGTRVGLSTVVSMTLHEIKHNNLLNKVQSNL
jgi:hypothetical protein